MNKRNIILDSFYILELIIQIIVHLISQVHKMLNNDEKPTNNQRGIHRDKIDNDLH